MLLSNSVQRFQMSDIMYFDIFESKIKCTTIFAGNGLAEFVEQTRMPLYAYIQRREGLKHVQVRKCGWQCCLDVFIYGQYQLAI